MPQGQHYSTKVGTVTPLLGVKPSKWGIDFEDRVKSSHRNHCGCSCWPRTDEEEAKDHSINLSGTQTRRALGAITEVTLCVLTPLVPYARQPQCLQGVHSCIINPICPHHGTSWAYGRPGERTPSGYALSSLRELSPESVSRACSLLGAAGPCRAVPQKLLTTVWSIC